jgi:hypothetical protein
MPHSVVLLDVHEASVTARLELPVGDFSTASGIDLNTVRRPAHEAAAAIRTYLAAHIRPTTLKGEAWQVSIGAAELSRTEQTSTGPYRELIAQAVLTPPAGGDVRHFTLDYDVIVHQVVTHTALVSVRQDWAAGHGSRGRRHQVGTIRIDVRHMKVPPLTVDLGDGSAWRGFLAMLGSAATTSSPAPTTCCSCSSCCCPHPAGGPADAGRGWWRPRGARPDRPHHARLHRRALRRARR